MSDKAIAVLRAGGLIVMPTDTVYGIAADPAVDGAVAALMKAKGRPEHKPIPVLGASLADLRSIANFDEAAGKVATSMWPGPLTLVLPRADGFDIDLGGDALDTVAVRVPAHPIARELLSQTGPLAVSSANRSGERESHSVAEARKQLGDLVEVYIDGGACAGRASTVVSLVGEVKVLREGEIGAAEIAQILSS